MEIIRKAMGERIKMLREKMQLSQKQLAGSIGMKTQYLSNVEKGLNGLTIEKLIEICNVTGTSADYIIFGTNSISTHQIQNNFSKYTDEEISMAFEIIKNIIILYNK